MLMSYFFVPLVEKMLVELKCTCPNYKGVNIPTAMGIAAIPVIVLLQAILYLFLKDVRIIAITLSAVFMALVGLLDDLVGQKDVKGFKGHIRELLGGRLTTGGLKAIVGFFTAFFVSAIFSSTYTDILLNTVLISLFTNTLNLLDLRPGRAIKFFALVFIIESVFAYRYAGLLLPIVGFILVYFPLDIKARGMLGDTGSNLLGAALGAFTAVSLNFNIRLGITLLLILIHVIAEKYSITRLIEKSRVLKFFDELGRR